MQYHLRVCILGHAEPQNWFYSSVEVGYIPLYLVKVPFRDSYYIFSGHLILTFLFENTKLRIIFFKKSRSLFSDILGWSEKGKQTSFFRPNFYITYQGYIVS